MTAAALPAHVDAPRPVTAVKMPGLLIERADAPALASVGRASVVLTVGPDAPGPDRWQVSDRGFHRSLDTENATWLPPHRMPARLRRQWLIAQAALDAASAPEVTE